MTQFNHSRPLSDFHDNIDKLMKAGYKPVAVTQMYFEDVYVFETKAEARAAYKKFEDNDDPEMIAWWYGREDFLNEVSDYERHDEIKVKIFWL
jgi:hypothetical protein